MLESGADLAETIEKAIAALSTEDLEISAEVINMDFQEMQEAPKKKEAAPPAAAEEEEEEEAPKPKAAAKSRSFRPTPTRTVISASSRSSLSRLRASSGQALPRCIRTCSACPRS